MKILIIVNPISGDINKEPFLTEIEQICFNYGIEIHIFKTTGFHDEADIELILSEFKPNKVISVGGDGTTLLTAKVLQNTPYPMGIIPLGSANGMATELGIDASAIEEFKDILLSNFVVDLDIVEVNGESMLHIGDVGANANLVAAFANDDNRGLATYAKYLFEQLREQEVFDFTIKCNNQVIESQGIMIAICNARKYGTGIPLNTIGNPMDGKFELVVIENINLSSLIKAGLATWDDKFIEQEGLVLSTEEAEIIFDKPRLLQLDGEVINKFDRLLIKIQKGSLKLITNRTNMEELSNLPKFLT